VLQQLHPLEDTPAVLGTLGCVCGAPSARIVPVMLASLRPAGRDSGAAAARGGWQGVAHDVRQHGQSTRHHLQPGRRQQHQGVLCRLALARWGAGLYLCPACLWCCNTPGVRHPHSFDKTPLLLVWWSVIHRHCCTVHCCCCCCCCCCWCRWTAWSWLALGPCLRATPCSRHEPTQVGASAVHWSWS
jgi:hypothetical protein